MSEALLQQTVTVFPPDVPQLIPPIQLSAQIDSTVSILLGCNLHSINTIHALLSSRMQYMYGRIYTCIQSLKLLHCVGFFGLFCNFCFPFPSRKHWQHSRLSSPIWNSITLVNVFVCCRLEYRGQVAVNFLSHSDLELNFSQWKCKTNCTFVPIFIRWFAQWKLSSIYSD